MTLHLVDSLEGIYGVQSRDIGNIKADLRVFIYHQEWNKDCNLGRHSFKARGSMGVVRIVHGAASGSNQISKK